MELTYGLLQLPNALTEPLGGSVGPAELKDLSALLKKAITPLVVLRLADLMPVAQLGYRTAPFESFQYDLELLLPRPFLLSHIRPFLPDPSQSFLCFISGAV
jgi:hypothetical protein